MSHLPPSSAEDTREALEQISRILGDLDAALGDRIDRAYAVTEAAIRRDMDREAASRLAAPVGDYTAEELACRGCMGPCGRCHEIAAPVGEKRKVWVGHSDGEPHVYRDPASPNGSRIMAVFATRAEARQNYEDARKMWLIPAEAPHAEP